MTSPSPRQPPAPGPDPSVAAVGGARVLTQGVRHLLLAVQFYSRAPVVGRLAQWVGFTPQMLRRSGAHLPAVGWLVGLPAALVLAGADRLWPPAVAAVLTVALMVWVTGAFHEDGLADTADGLGGSVPRARSLEIMRDSRIGTYGATALVLGLGLRVALLAGLLTQGLRVAVVALLVAQVLSRFAPLVLMRALRYVGGSDGKAALTADGVSLRGLAVAAGWCAPALALAVAELGAGAAGLLLGVGLPLWWVGRLLRRRLGGYTGDTLGAAQQLVELGVYLVLLARW